MSVTAWYVNVDDVDKDTYMELDVHLWFQSSQQWFSAISFCYYGYAVLVIITNFYPCSDLHFFFSKAPSEEDDEVVLMIKELLDTRIR